MKYTIQEREKWRVSERWRRKEWDKRREKRGALSYPHAPGKKWRKVWLWSWLRMLVMTRSSRRNFSSRTYVHSVMEVRKKCINREKNWEKSVSIEGERKFLQEKQRKEIEGERLWEKRKCIKRQVDSWLCTLMLSPNDGVMRIKKMPVRKLRGERNQKATMLHFEIWFMKTELYSQTHYLYIWYMYI